jgi:hypothetical protein
MRRGWLLIAWTASACQSSVAIDDVTFACASPDDCTAGKTDATVGEIDASPGEIDAFKGETDASAPEIDALTPEIDASTDEIDAWTGEIDTTGEVDGLDAEVAEDVPLCTTTSCKDDNPCTGDACDPVKGCVYLPVAGTCSDGDQCTVDDKCSGGACVAGAKFACDDLDSCTADRCVTGSGCKHAPQDAPCNDGDACTNGDVCAGGKCGGKPISCDDSNPCTYDTCDKKDGCGYAVNGKPCDDGNKCTSQDTCTPQGFCQGSFTCACKEATGAVDCDDKNPCTVDTCSTEFKCSNTPQAGGGCDDGKPCTSDDLCDAKGARAGKAVDCKSLDGPCVAGVCDPAAGKCVAQVKNALCSDGDVCTVSDACEGGKCKGGALNPCDDGNLCTTDGCDPKSGCTATPKPANTYDDGNGCTKDACDP